MAQKSIWKLVPKLQINRPTYSYDPAIRRRVQDVYRVKDKRSDFSTCFAVRAVFVLTTLHVCVCMCVDVWGCVQGDIRDTSLPHACLLDGSEELVRFAHFHLYRANFQSSKVEVSSQAAERARSWFNFFILAPFWSLAKFCEPTGPATCKLDSGHDGRMRRLSLNENRGRL